MAENRHDCPGGCGRSVGRRLLACPDCWLRLPVDIRRAVSAGWALRARDPSPHRVALADALAWYRDKSAVRP